MTLGEKLSRLRKENNYTQEQLAGILGVSRQAVSKWESDMAFPETDKIIKMGEMYHCSLDYLLKDAAETSTFTTENTTWSPKAHYYERKSKRSINGVPLWHINVGLGRTAKGIIAIGLVSKGIISIGLLSIGIVSLGILSLGALSLGIFALGLLAVGCFSAGAISIGAICFGIVTLGALAIGEFSVGALAIGNYAAIGDNARAMIAIGKTEAVGSLFQKVGEINSQERQAIIGLLQENVPVYFGWAKEIIKIFL